MAAAGPAAGPAAGGGGGGGGGGPAQGPSQSTAPTGRSVAGSVGSENSGASPHALARSGSSLSGLQEEGLLWVQAWSRNPDRARLWALEQCEISSAAAASFRQWSALEERFKGALERVQQCEQQLVSLRGDAASVTAAAIGSLPGLARHHSALAESLLVQAAELEGVAREVRREVAERSERQVALQKDAVAQRALLSRAKADKAPEAQQLAAAYDEKARLQERGLRRLLVALFQLQQRRAAVQRAAVAALVRAAGSAHDFAQEAGAALREIVKTLDPAREIASDVDRIAGGSATPAASTPGQTSPTPSATRLTDPSALYTRLCEAAPDSASAHVDRAAAVCANASALCVVGESAAEALAVALEQRGRDLHDLAQSLAPLSAGAATTTAMASSFQSVSSPTAALPGAGATSAPEESEEKRAWRALASHSRKAALVMTQAGARQRRVASGMAAEANRHKQSKAQLEVAKAAASRELQRVAMQLQESKARAEAAVETLKAQSEALEKLQSEALELQRQRSASTSSTTSTSSSAASSVSLASHVSSSSSTLASSSSSAVAGAGAAAAGAGTGSSAAANAFALAGGLAAVPVPAGATTAGASGAAAAASSAASPAPADKSSANKLLFFMGGSLAERSLEERLSEADERLQKQAARRELAREQSEEQHIALSREQDRLEAQFKAFSVQIAGAVSGQVSAHAQRLPEVQRLVAEFAEALPDMASSAAGLAQRLEALAAPRTHDDVVRAAQFPAPEPPMLVVPVQFKTKDEDIADDLPLAGSSEQSITDAVAAAAAAVAAGASPATALLLLPHDEAVLGSFSCALASSKVQLLPPQQGKMLLSKRFLGFFTMPTSFWGAPAATAVRIVVELPHVRAIHKVSSMGGLVNNSLSVQLHPLTASFEPLELHFTSFVQRDKCFDQLQRLLGSERHHEHREQQHSPPGPAQGQIHAQSQPQSSSRQPHAAAQWAALDPRIEHERALRVQQQQQQHKDRKSLPKESNKVMGGLLRLLGKGEATGAAEDGGALNLGQVTDGTARQRSASDVAPPLSAHAMHDNETQGAAQHRASTPPLAARSVAAEGPSSPNPAQAARPSSQAAEAAAAAAPTPPGPRAAAAAAAPAAAVAAAVAASGAGGARAGAGEAVSAEAGSRASARAGAASATAALEPCERCGAAPSLHEPCKCWSGAAVPLKEFELLATMHWRGPLAECVQRLWLDSDNDLALELSRQQGDTELHFPPFGSPRMDRAGYPSSVSETDMDDALGTQAGRWPSASQLERVVSFARHMQTPIGRQVAKSTQVQRVLGCRAPGEKQSLAAEGPSACVHNVTSFLGFPYAEAFVVHHACVLTQLTHSEDKQLRSFTRIDIMCRIVWLKAPAVPFLKSKIERENTLTSKSNWVAWIALARAKAGASGSGGSNTSGASGASGTSGTSDAAPALSAPAAEAPTAPGKGAAALDEPLALQELLQELQCAADARFYARAWRAASDTQRLQLLLLAACLALQLATVTAALLARLLGA